MTNFIPHTIPDGRRDIDGKEYMEDAKGNLVPVELIKPQHLLEDQTVRVIVGFAIALSGQVARFKAHTYDDLDAFDLMLAEKYGLKKGGKKGNRTYQSLDGLYKVQVQVADRINFGSELQIAKALIDECLNEWAAESRAEIRTIVTRAFNTDQEGKVNRAEIIMLTKLDIDDERWVRAMQAIEDAKEVTSTKDYVRCYWRTSQRDRWQAITIDLAKA